MSLTLIGYIALAAALFTAGYGVFAAVAATLNQAHFWKESLRLACLLLFPLLSIAGVALLILLVREDFQVDYVFQTISSHQPLYLKIAAIWGKQSGSLLFWTWLFSFFMFVWIKKSIQPDDPNFTTSSLFLLINAGFFIGLNLFVEHPFNRYWQDLSTGTIYTAMFQPAHTIPYTPGSGLGMNPVLRHYGMIFHPPALYLGYISIFIPGAYQVSTLIHRQTGTDWLKKTRSWYLFAWFFLAVGLILGSRWAYDVLGWGGYWGWDPVEVSALIPFLLLTAFIHAVIGNIYTQKYQRWLMVSGLLSLFSIVISTFVTRSGLISSVHAFSASPLSRPLSIYFGLFFIFILGLIILRWHSVSPSSPSTEEQPTAKFSLFSRHFVFNAMILILFVITFFCLWGIFLPNISALFSDRPITIGKDYYTSSTGPLFLLFILLTGFFPLSHWKQADKSKDRLALILLSAVAAVIAAVVNFKTGTSSLMTILAVWIIAFSFFVYLYDWLRNAVTYQDGKRVLVFSKFWTQFTKNPRRFSILLLHTGLLLMALGILGIESFQAEERLTMTKDQTVTFHNYAITYQGIQESEFPEGSLLRADFQVVDENNRETVIQPQKRFFSAYQQMTTIPGIQSNLAGDLYLILNQADETEASFTFYYNPLINWLWIGSILLCLGGVFIYFGSLKRKKLHVQ